MKELSRDEILAANDITKEKVEVPEWGGFVWVTALSGEERDAYEKSLVLIRGTKATPALENARAKLVAKAIVDENGKRLFSDVDVKALGKKSAAALQRVWDKARELSRLSDEDIEELTENLDETPPDDSTSDSP